MVERLLAKEKVAGSNPVRRSASNAASPESRVCKRAPLDGADSKDYMNETSDVSNLKYFVYILYSLKDKGLYIGFTTNLRNRISRHNRGEVFSTSGRRPFKVIYYESFINIKDAKTREIFLKSGFGRSNLKKALQRTLTDLNT